MKSNILVCTLFVSTILALAVNSAAAGTVIHVPADQPTIQAGINAAVNGDTVLVAPGTYKEILNFLGKAITVKGSAGAKATIIDGGQTGSVVTFNSGEAATAVLTGFTIRNGNPQGFFGEGGGVLIVKGSPMITKNVITQNTACGGGAGILLSTGAPVIKGNTISQNSQTVGCSGGDGGALTIHGGKGALILNNTIIDNPGGGIVLNSTGSLLVENNVITGNSGSAVTFINDSVAIIVQNLIYKNGQGIYLSPSYGTAGSVIVSNTVVDNGGTQASALFAGGFDSSAQIADNLFVDSSGLTAVYCDNTAAPPTFSSNDAYSSGASWAGGCAAETGTNGNISADPLFVKASANNYRILGGSPAIDAGNNSAPYLPSTDFAGNARIVNGNGGSTAIIDMGAYEFLPVTLTPKTLNFGSQSVGSTTIKTVTLTNDQNKSLNISSKTAPTGYKVSGCGTSVAAFSSCSLTVTFHPLATGSFKGMLSVKDGAGNSPQTVSLSGSAH
jgi:hypothetical protein